MKHMASYLALSMVFLTSLLLSTPQTQNWLKSRYLGRAIIVGRITWGEAIAAKKVLAVEAPTNRIVQIGKRLQDGREQIIVYSNRDVYCMEHDVGSKLKVTGHGPYHP